MCEWFALCDNEANGYVDHPILGSVQTCSDCAGKFDLDLVEF